MSKVLLVRHGFVLFETGKRFGIFNAHAFDFLVDPEETLLFNDEVLGVFMNITNRLSLVNA